MWSKIKNLSLDTVYTTGNYDAGVNSIFNYVYNNLYAGGAGYGGSSCASTSASQLIDGSATKGICVHWSAVLLSLMRTMGVPQDRATIWDFKVGPSTAHAVAAYKSDSGQWQILDVTCCNAMVPLSQWHTACTGCDCISGGCVAYGNDYTKGVWPGSTSFDSACSCPSGPARCCEYDPLEWKTRCVPAGQCYDYSPWCDYKKCRLAGASAGECAYTVPPCS